MAEMDWIGVRSRCTAARLFEHLKEQLQKDVEDRQALRPPDNTWYGFHLDIGRNRASVMLEGHGLESEAVVFYLKPNSILIVDGAGKHKFEATPTVNDEGECRLKVNGEERELWQFRKKALEEVFFRPNLTFVPAGDKKA
jgi:hypothetical protein